MESKGENDVTKNSDGQTSGSLPVCLASASEPPLSAPPGPWFFFPQTSKFVAKN